jgi:hypothetical protein
MPTNPTPSKHPKKGNKKMKPAIFFLFAATALAIPTQAQQVVECRDLAPNGYVAPNESIINGKACRPAGTPLQAIDPNTNPNPAPAPTAAATPAPSPTASEAPAATPPSDGKTRVLVTDSQSWETRGGGSAGGNRNGWGGSSWQAGGARPQTAEIIKTLNQRCPELTVTSNLDRADFVLTLAHEGGKGALAHRNKVAVFNHEGDVIFSASTRELGNSVKDACHAMLSAKR